MAGWLPLCVLLVLQLLQLQVQVRGQLLRGQLGPLYTEAVWNTLLEQLLAGPQEPADRRFDALLAEYDVVVVGAGTAGCVLANRLSAVAGWTVLLVEAGRDEIFVMDIPIATNLLQFSEANWKYRTQPSNSSCLGMSGRRCNFPRGKVPVPVPVRGHAGAHPGPGSHCVVLRTRTRSSSRTPLRSHARAFILRNIVFFTIFF